MTRDVHGRPAGFDYFPNGPLTYPLTCANCGGDLLAGRNATVCERNCDIRHETPVDWLEKYHPERRIMHNSWATIRKDVSEGARKLAAIDKAED